MQVSIRHQIFLLNNNHPIVVIFIMLYGLGGKAGFDPSAQKPLEDKGRDLAADVLSFGGIVYGSFTGVRVLF